MQFQGGEHQKKTLSSKKMDGLTHWKKTETECMLSIIFSFPFFLLFSFCISCHYNFFLFTRFFFYFFLVWSIVGSCGLCVWSYPRLFTMLCRWARVGLVSTLLHGLSGGVFTGIKVTLAVWLLDGSGRENNRNGAGNNSGLYSRVQWS